MWFSMSIHLGKLKYHENKRRCSGQELYYYSQVWTNVLVEVAFDLSMKLQYFWDKLELVFLLWIYMSDFTVLGYLWWEQIKDEDI